MKKLFILLLGICFVSTTAFGQSKEDKKQLKKEKEQREYLAAKDLVDSQAFQFIALQVLPLGGQPIFVNATPHYLYVDGEQADVYLPYFGVIQVSSGNSGQAGIKFKGTMENYQVEYNDKKQRVDVKFEIQVHNERHFFDMDVYKGGKASITLTSSSRNAITYNGDISQLETPLTN